MAYYGNEPAKVAVKVGSGVITATELADDSITTADIIADAITPTELDEDGTGFQVGTLGVGAAVSGGHALLVSGSSSFGNAFTSGYFQSSSSGIGFRAAALSYDTLYYSGSNRIGFSGSTTQRFDCTAATFTGTIGSGAITSSGNISSTAGNIDIAATKKIFLDGGGDTYIQEDSANNILFQSTSATFAGTVYAQGSGSATNRLEFIADTMKSLGSDLVFATDGGTTLTLTRNDNNATFAGSVGIGGVGVHAGGSLHVGGTNGIRLDDNTNLNWSTPKIVGNNSSDFLKFSTSTTDVFTLIGANATFAGAVGVGGVTATTYHNNADNFVIYEASAPGMTIAGGANNVGRIFFAEGTASDTADTGWHGYIDYNHNNHRMSFGTNNAEALAFDSSRNATFAGTVTQTGNYFTIDHSAQNGIKIEGNDTACIYIYDKADDSLSGGLTFSHDTAEFLVYTNGVSSNSEALKIASNNNSTFAGDVTIKSTNKLTVGNSDEDEERFRIANASTGSLIMYAGGQAANYNANTSWAGVLTIGTRGGAGSGVGWKSLETRGGCALAVTAGNVGIGHDSASYKLDVNGTFGVSGTATFAGTVKVANADANAEFQIGDNDTYETPLVLCDTSRVYSKYFGLLSSGSSYDLCTLVNGCSGTIILRTNHNNGEGIKYYTFVNTVNARNLSAIDTNQPYSPAANSLSLASDGTISIDTLPYDQYTTLYVTCLVGTLTWDR